MIDRKLLRWATEQRGAFGMALGTSVVAAALVLAQAWFLSQVVARVLARPAGLSPILSGILALAGVAVLRATLIGLATRASQGLALRVKAATRARLLAGMLARGPAWLRGERQGELAMTAQRGVEDLDEYYSAFLPQVAITVVVPLMILLIVLPRDPLTGLVLVLAAPMMPVLMALIGQLSASVTRRQWASLSRLSAHFADVVQGLPTLKLFGRAQRQADVIARYSIDYRDTTLRVLRVTFLNALVMEILGTIATAIVAVEVGLRLLYGQLDFATAFFLLLLAPEFFTPLRLLSQQYHAAQSGVAAGQRIQQVIPEAVADEAGGGRLAIPTAMAADHLAGQIRDPRSIGTSTAAIHGLTPAFRASDVRNQAPDGRRIAPIARSAAATGPVTLRFESVSYTYPGATQPVLKDLSLEWRGAINIALVGLSGVGKSTLARLLLREIVPDSGRILLNEVDIQTISLDQWHAQIGWASATPHLFHDTVAANIAIGLGEDRTTRAEIRAAARLAQIEDEVDALPAGFDTVIGGGGAALSGGQAQRIGLARAFLYHAPILILDEALAHLDPRQTLSLWPALSAHTRGGITLVIAHRAEMMRQVDAVYTIADGQCVPTPVSATGAELAPDRHLAHLNAESASDHVSTPRKCSSDDRHAAVNGQGARSDNPQIPQISAAPRHTLEQNDGLTGSPQPLVRLLGWLWPHRRMVALAILLGAVTIISAMGLMGTSAYIISAAANHPSEAALAVAIVGVRFFGIARGVFRYLERLVAHTVTFTLLADLRVWFFTHLVPLVPARLLRFRDGDLLGRALADIDALQMFYVRAVAPPAVALVVVIGTAIFLGAFDLRLALAVTGCLLLAGIGLPWLAQVLGRKAGTDLVAARARLYQEWTDTTAGAEEVWAFGLAERQQRRVAAAQTAYATSQARLATVTGLTNGLMSFTTQAAVIATLVIAIPSVTAGRLPGVFLAVVALIAQASFEAVAPLPAAAQQLAATTAAAARVFAVIDAAPAPDAGWPDASASSMAAAPVLHPQPLPDDSTITAENLTFRYSDREGDAIRDLSFIARPGARVAIVGPSGAGKSTLAALLTRAYDPVAGRLTLGGVDLRDLDPDALLTRLAVVSQATYLFAGTVRQNVRIARPDASDDELWAALERAELATALVADADLAPTWQSIRPSDSELPEGLDTPLGEHGARWSAGQRQRLAIARALLRDAPILLLDEATSNLDATAEDHILSTIATAFPTTTILAITHRLARMAMYDQILVLADGRLVQHGTHKELLAQSGLYRDLWEAQHGPLQFPAMLQLVPS